MILQRIWKTAGLLILFCGLARASTITSFSAPGAGTTGPFPGTFALSINAAGTITGYFIDGNGVAHGFLRGADGVFTTFDAPGAGTSLFEGTLPVAISLTGEVAGSYVDANLLAHGFVRAKSGTITPFDAPSAAIIGTLPSGISPQGVVTGTFFDANFVAHGFLRAANGAITVFDDPNASTTFLGTFPVALDPRGTVVGCFTDSSFAGFPFLRTPAGVFSTLNPPGSSPGLNVPCASVIFSVVQNMAISPQAMIAGAYFEGIQGNVFGGNYRGFVRAVDGTFSTFDAVPSPSTPCCTWTFPISINPQGEVAGFDNDFNSVNHGFVRTTSGAITVFDVPGASATVATSINPAGIVTGYFFENGVAHGFVRTP